eukprot:6192855-Pleurochrysis_carterae.AAC.2
MSIFRSALGAGPLQRPSPTGRRPQSPPTAQGPRRLRWRWAPPRTDNIKCTISDETYTSTCMFVSTMSSDSCTISDETYTSTCMFVSTMSSDS